MMPLFTAFLLPLMGCSSSEEKAWQQGYDANYRAHYQTGLQAGEARDSRIGEERGRAAAQVAAEEGSAWQLYSALVFFPLTCGFIVGLSAQYIILWHCGLSGRLPQLLTMAFVPAMKSSLSYSIFERRQQLMVALEEEFSKISAAKHLQNAQTEAMKEVVVRKLMSAASIEELSLARLVDFAEKESSKIVSAAEEKYSRINNDQQPLETKPRSICFCPYCLGRVQY